MSDRWRKVSALYHAALERDGDQREAFLREACGADEPLRLEVESLLGREDAAEQLQTAGAIGAAWNPATRPPSPTAGQQIGPYTIISFVGAGGMGEVYRARDTRLGRDVALKILPPEFTANAERRARFEREARLLAVLNHPNIAQVHGLEESHGMLALVMEFVDGPTLADVIRPSTPAAAGLTLDRTLGIARQIASGLAAAHEKGIIHRDLKPSNVKIASDGTTKLLDFGLAKAISGDNLSGDSQAPTLTKDATGAGAIMGTAGYMSPEQARGEPVDKRTDVWAFGCLLYEMLTGSSAFERKTLSDTFAAVLTSEPEWTRLGPIARTPIGLLAQRCLEKDRQARLGDISTALFVIDERANLSSGAGSTPSDGSRRGWRGRHLVAAVAAVAAIAIAVSLWFGSRPTQLQPLIHLDVNLGGSVSLDAPAGVTISPDGLRLVATSPQGLVTRRLEQSELTLLAGTEEATRPFFSPDGQWVGFFAKGKLQKVPAAGGPVITLCDAPSLYGTATWGDDDQIVGTLGSSRALSRVSASGGAPVSLMKLDKTEGEFDYAPQVLPGSRAVIYNVRPPGTLGFSIEALSLTDGTRKALLPDASAPRYVPSGHLLYVKARTLYAVPFDVNRLEIRGTPTAMLGDVGSLAGASLSGTLLYLTPSPPPISTIQLLSPGSVKVLLAKPDAYVDPHLSADGERVVMGLRQARPDLWVHDLRQGKLTQLTFGDALPYALLTPDGRFVVFTGRTSRGLAWTRADGGGRAQPLLTNQNFQWRGSFTTDGRRLAYFELTSQDYFDIWTVPVDITPGGLKAGRPERFLDTPKVDERHPAFSPDGRWLAYTSNESGSYEVWVRAFPDKELRWRVSTEGGVTPAWSRSTSELFFRGPDNKVRVASYSVSGDSFSAGRPRVWSNQTLTNVGLLDPSFDVAPDGKQAIALIPQARPPRQEIVVLLNFFDELRRRAPVR